MDGHLDAPCQRAVAPSECGSQDPQVLKQSYNFIGTCGPVHSSLRHFCVAGLGLSDQKSAARRDHAHRNRLQNLC
jgi:hypothetical protein